MKAIVADAYGNGVRIDADGDSHPLSPDDWTEVDVRDRIIATFGTVVVRYRDDGRQVEVPVGSTYDIEYHNDDVIDVSTAESQVDELLLAMQGPAPTSNGFTTCCGRSPGSGARSRTSGKRSSAAPVAHSRTVSGTR